MRYKNVKKPGKRAWPVADILATVIKLTIAPAMR